MKMKDREKLDKILASQRFAVLGTSGADCPYQSIVAFAAAPDSKRIFFATPRQSRKYDNLKLNGNASIFIDDRSNSERDIEEATGICVMGTAKELGVGEMETALKFYCAKHPAMKDFAHATATAIFSLKVSKCLMVRKFQNVIEIIP